jgi:hypothetical protein
MCKETDRKANEAELCTSEIQKVALTPRFGFLLSKGADC